jgi:hypothetical protein
MATDDFSVPSQDEISARIAKFNDDRHKGNLTSAAARQAFAASAIRAIEAALPALEIAMSELAMSRDETYAHAFRPNITGGIFPTALATITLTCFDGKPTATMRPGMTAGKPHVDIEIRGRDSDHESREVCLRLIFDPTSCAFIPARDLTRG